MRSSVLRVYRQQLLTGFRRYASTSSNASQQASSAASASAAKAKEAAGKAVEILGKSGESFARLAAKTGGRTGKVLKSIEAAVPPTIYYSKVMLEVSKLVFRGQNMSPPDLATFKTTFKTLFNSATFETFARNAVQTVRSVTVKDVALAGVLGAEILGFFTVGEIIGRRKLIGYRPAQPAHH